MMIRFPDFMMIRNRNRLKQKKPFCFASSSLDLPNFRVWIPLRNLGSQKISDLQKKPFFSIIIRSPNFRFWIPLRKFGSQKISNLQKKPFCFASSSSSDLPNFKVWIPLRKFGSQNISNLQKKNILFCVIIIIGAPQLQNLNPPKKFWISKELGGIRDSEGPGRNRSYD